MDQPTRSKLLDAAIELMKANGFKPNGELHGVSAFLKTIDTILAGPPPEDRPDLLGRWSQDHSGKPRTK